MDSRRTMEFIAAMWALGLAASVLEFSKESIQSQELQRKFIWHSESTLERKNRVGCSENCLGLLENSRGRIEPGGLGGLRKHVTEAKAGPLEKESKDT